MIRRPASELPPWGVDPERGWAVTWTTEYCCARYGLSAVRLPVRLFTGGEGGPDAWHTAEAVWLRASLPADRLVTVLARELTRVAMEPVLRDYGVERPSERLERALGVMVAKEVASIVEAWQRAVKAERADATRQG